MRKMDGSSKFLIGCVLGVVILGLCIGWSGRDKELDLSKEGYYKIAMDKDITEDLSVIDKDLDGKEIFFTAEFHGTQMNMELELKFLKYLKEKVNFKYYLCELPYAQGLRLNEFLETGDVSILDEMYKHFEGTYAYTKDTYNRWLELYDYNQQFAKEDRIEVIGVDVEHQDAYAWEVVKMLLPEEVAPASIEENIKLLKADLCDAESLQMLYDNLMIKEEVYREYIGEAYFDVGFIINNILNRYYVKEDNNLFNARRDAVMYENFMAIYERLEPGKFYGQWGHNHTYQAEQGGVKWFGAALAEGEFKDKILTIAYTYDNCETISIKQDKTYGTEVLDTFEGYKLKDVNSGEGVLIDLKVPDTIFNEKLKYYQYFLVITDSKAVEVLK